MSKVKILVACHKPDKVYSNDVYIPIHVGRAVSRFKEEMSNMIGDDTGENISEKNPYYSELTAQYWAWKNMHDVDYVGLCHYRRYFQTEFTCNNIDTILGQKGDVVLAPTLGERYNIGDRLIRATCMEDVYIFVQCIKKISHDYYDTAMKVLSHNEVSPFNMFVMRRDLFDDFARWQFDILFEMEKHVILSGYSRMRRVFGYVSEMMLTTYALHNDLRVIYMPIVSMLGEESDIILNLNSGGRLRRFINKHIITKGGFSFQGDDAIRIGLKNDGIEV